MTNVMNKTMPRFVAVVLALVMLLALVPFTRANALEAGAYVAGRSTSYANPDTGETVDGGTNIELGDSMCAKIVDTNVLVEYTGSEYYVTLGLGLQSSISNIRFYLQKSGSDYYSVSATKTGSCSRDDDTCNHYRFKMSSLSQRISIRFYVEAMGRDVQFFVDLNTGNMKQGTANFKSEMISATTTEKAAEKTTKEATTKAKKTTKESKEDKTEAETTAEAETAEESSSGSTTGIIIGVVAAVVVIGAVVAVVLLKKKGN